MPSPLRICALAALALACSDRRELGGFEDDLGDDEAATPDLPKPECVPRAMGVDACADDEKCSYVIDPQFGPTGSCVGLEGEGAPGEPCTKLGESDTCGAGSICWSIDAITGEGVCTSFCSSFLTCEEDALPETPELICIVGDEGLLALCLEACHPLVPDTCPPGFGCYDSSTGRWGCDRDQSGAGGAHASSCDCVNCCDPGLICRPAALVEGPECELEGAVGCCTPTCELVDAGEEPFMCPAEGESCRAYYGVSDIPAGFEDVGFCRL